MYFIISQLDCQGSFSCNCFLYMILGKCYSSFFILSSGERGAHICLKVGKDRDCRNTHVIRLIMSVMY